jgi:UDP-N-acetylglucosamine 2-epimerase
VINIGKRQQGRLRSGNVIDVGYRALDIAQTLRSILSSRRRIRVRNVYGNGTSAQRIVRILEQWFKQREQSV